MSKSKSRLSVLLVIIMLIAMFPATTFAATGVSSVPTGSAEYFFANGTPVTITDDKPEGATEVEIAGFTATGNDAYISWDNASGGVSCIGVDESTRVYGGSDGRNEVVTVENTSITMTGGTVSCLFGGNLGMQDNDPSHTSIVTGNTNIAVSGQTAMVTLLLHGGGQFNSAVNGTAFIDVANANLTYANADGTLNGCYINGGTNGNGKEGIRDIDDSTIISNAHVANAIINITESKAYLVGGGGSGSTSTGNAKVDITNSEVEAVYLTGINGEIDYVSMNIAGSQVGNIAASNRGFVKNADVSIENSSIGTLNTGADTGCFTSDSGSNDATGVTGQVNWYLDAESTVAEANITPYIRNDNGTYTAQVSNTYISKTGTPLELKLGIFEFNSNKDATGATTVSQFTLPKNSHFSFDGIALTVPSGVKLAVEGNLSVGSTSSLFVAQGTLDAAEDSVYVYDGAKVEGVSQEQMVKYYNFNITAGIGGKIDPPYEQLSVREGGTLKLTITPDQGYIIADVTVNGVSQGAVSELTLENISESADIVASFKAESASVTEPDDPEDNPTDNPKDEPSDKPIESDVSKTGDSSNIALWAALVLISAYALNRLRAYARK